MVVSCSPGGFPDSRIRLHRSKTTNINASIVDLRVTGIVDTHPEWFPWPDENRRKSAAFVVLCMSTALELPLEDCIDLLTDGASGGLGTGGHAALR